MTTSWVIHVVDDDEPVRSSLAFALQAVGFLAIPYVDADDFLKRGLERRGVLLSDFRMPGMDGIQLTRRLRQGGSVMPILLMTGHAEAGLQNDAMSAGADLVLQKPIVWPALLAEINRITIDWP